jgi:3-hydroxymyristoyl/3-hydroxydecanoyl-(acyl carrier protein) dehydratase
MAPSSEPTALQLPEIDSLRQDAGGVSLSFVVPAESSYFDGHFPECPLLPGVVQVGWAIELARRYLPAAPRFRGLSGVKFMRVIQPGAAIVLRLEAAADGRELSFEYRCDGQPCSSGRVSFH